jgi:tetratricopeptide (TPR) repeat protein
MKRVYIYILLILLIGFSVFSIFSRHQYRQAQKEYLYLLDAYKTRMDWEIGFSAYARILDKVKQKRAEALYNLANASFREAQHQKSLALLQSAIEYYKEALREKPDFLEAKKNLEVAESLAARIGFKIRTIKAPGEDKGRGLEPGLIPYVPTQP